MAGRVSTSDFFTPVVRAQLPRLRRRGGGTKPPSDLRLFRDLEGVIDLDAEVPHSGLQIGVPEEQLHGTQIFGAPIDRRCPGAA